MPNYSYLLDALGYIYISLVVHLDLLQTILNFFKFSFNDMNHVMTTF